MVEVNCAYKQGGYDQMQKKKTKKKNCMYYPKLQVLASQDGKSTGRLFIRQDGHD